MRGIRTCLVTLAVCLLCTRIHIYHHCVGMFAPLQEHLRALKAKWKAALKKNKKLLLKCPNYEVRVL